jgi:uncharacterized protein YcbK (DUF882 family)
MRGFFVSGGPVDKLSHYFARSEFQCRCGCGFNTVDAALITVLSDVREHFGKPVTINSACRCDTYNAKIGGAKNSQHRLGRAADIVVAGVEPVRVADYLNTKYPSALGLGRYRTFTHVDTRCGLARWHG